MIEQPTLEIEAQIPQPPDSDVAIRVREVGKLYRIYERPQDRLKQMLLWRFGRSYGHEFWALRDVSLEIRRGQTVGIIGRNGSGKSTLLQIIAGTLAPTTGEVEVRGRVAALLELGSGFNPEFTGRENVYLNAAILGLSREQTDALYDEIAAFADIGEFIEQPTKTYSSGMVVRLAFAVAACVEPEILIVDEALAVGDIAFQARCLDRIKKLQALGTTTLFVTHDTGTFQNLCDYGYMLDHGQIFTHGRPAQVAMQYYELMRASEHTRQRLSATEAADTARVRAESRAEEATIRGKTDDGEYRFGTSGARIIDYVVANHAGQESSALEIGRRFSVTVTVRFYERVENLAVGVMFRNAQGQNLMGMHSYVEHRISFGAHDADEELSVTVTQEMLLNPGDYLLSIGIADCRSDYDFTSLDNRSNLAKISVFGKPLGYGLVHTRPVFMLNGTPIVQQSWQDMRWKDWTSWLLERCERYAAEARHVFEIGGAGQELKSFLPGRSFTTLNYPVGDICRPTEHPDGAFDLIVSKMTFEHLYDPFSAADEMTRLLAPGGVVIVMTVWSWRHHKAPGFDDYWRFSDTGLAQLFPSLEVLEAGFDLEDRRKDCRLDQVPLDELGGWREHWYVFLVARKPLHAPSRLDRPVRRHNRALLDATPQHIRDVYSALLSSAALSETLKHIRTHLPATADNPPSLERLARVWPQDAQQSESDEQQAMLGRYAFAGAQFCRAADVLDTSGGPGWGAYLVASFARTVTARVASPQTVEECAATWQRDNIRWLAGDARDLSFLGEQLFDVALGIETIEHFSQADGATYVRSVAGALRPGGIFIGTSAFPETEAEAEALRRTNPFHPHILTRAEMLALLRQHFSHAAVIGNWMFLAMK